MIRVVLPTHLRTLAGVNDEVQLDVQGEVTQRTVIDALCDTGVHYGQGFLFARPQFPLPAVSWPPGPPGV